MKGMVTRLGLTLVVLCALGSGCLWGQYHGGAGTQTDPWQLNDAADWQVFVGNWGHLDNYFVLTGDIDLEGLTVESVGPFSGVIDGAGHSISNVIIDKPDQSNIGLFQWIKPGGVIKNLRLLNITVNGSSYLGGLTGNNDGMIDSCHVTAQVSGTTNFAGGLTGQNYQGTIRNSSASATVSGGWQVGGLAGGNSGTITACFSTGSISGDAYVGGLVGENFTEYNQDAFIRNCYSHASVTGNYIAGGLVGENYFSVIEFCYATGAVSSLEYPGGLTRDDGGLIRSCFWDVETSGQTGSAGGKGHSSAMMKSKATFGKALWPELYWTINDGLDYPRLLWEQKTGSPVTPVAVPFSGNGTLERPYLIRTAHEFAQISHYLALLDKHILLKKDLDLTGKALFPIGDLGPFSGAFDGHGHTLRNPTIALPQSDYVGIFAHIARGGQVGNLTIENADLQGRAYVGGLAGYNDGSLTGGSVSGTVTGSDNVGGLAGINTHEVSRCQTHCTVNGNWQVGGLIGTLDNGLTQNSCATGALNGNDYAGGLVGSNWNNGQILKCYASGKISASGIKGGLLSAQNNSFTSDSFWDSQSTGLAESAGGAARSTAEMFAINTYQQAGWDFSNSDGDPAIWFMPSNNYPSLTSASFSTNLVNFYALSSCWMKIQVSPLSFCAGTDLNHDGHIDLTDLTIMLNGWME